jgi:prepilin-type processing-associated H-X9-DG protein
MLPFIEQQNVYEQGAGGTAAQKKAAAEQLVRTPLGILHCPSRRSAKLYPHRPSTASSNRPFNPGIGGLLTDPLTNVARADYAINGGGSDPGTQPGPTTIAAAASYAWADPKLATGVSFIRSQVSPALIRDGTSNTYLIGEKYLNPANYESWDGIGDAQTAYMGFDLDVVRVGSDPPIKDYAGVSSDRAFGSPHTGGFAMAFCDGSVHLIDYSIDPVLHLRLGERSDGQPVSLFGN